MKKISFYLWFIAVVCIAIEAHKALAHGTPPPEKPILFEVEEKGSSRGRIVPISILSSRFQVSFPRFAGKESIKFIRNIHKDKDSEDHILFSLIAVTNNGFELNDVVYHNFRCKVTYEYRANAEVKFPFYRHILLFHNCGNEEARLEDTVEISYALIVSFDAFHLPDNNPL